MEIPTIENILEPVESQHERDVMKSLRRVIRIGLMWAPESFSDTEPRMCEIIEQWIQQSDLEFKPERLNSGPRLRA